MHAVYVVQTDGYVTKTLSCDLSNLTAVTTDAQVGTCELPAAGSVSY